MNRVSRLTFLVICFYAIPYVFECYASSFGNDSSNLIPNSSFEEGKAPNPSSWRKKFWHGQGYLGISAEHHTGNRSVLITSIEGVDASWQIAVPVKPETKYRLSGWIKTKGVDSGKGRGAFINIQSLRDRQTQFLTGTNDWTYVEFYFFTGLRNEVTINCTLGGWGVATGKVWFDDIKLEYISGKDVAASVVIDVNNTGEPISKYIYGQLIEHLGKCVYGGMWAEMLEDRKFYFPIKDHFRGWDPTPNANFPENGFYKVLVGSPWRVIGPEGTVEMSRTNPFVGEHSPMVHVKGDGNPYGIKQDELWLIEERKYTGRIYISGDSQACPIHISLIWGKGSQDKETVVIRNIREDFEKFPFEFTAGACTKNGHLEIAGLGKGTFKIGCVSLMPADNIHGWRADVIELMKQLKAPIYKWPGGNFVSGYDWRDGIGDRDYRAPENNPAWFGIEDNDVGIHEFMKLCEILDAEPSLAVNTGSGDADMAAQLVEYVNGGQETEWGTLRAKNGHPEPYGVKLWYVGNEMWGTHQVGYIPKHKYVHKHNEVVQAMRSVDPAIKVVAVGKFGHWSETMLTECSECMDFISDNFYAASSPDLLNHVTRIPYKARQIVDEYRRCKKTLPTLEGRDISLAIDEWAYWYGKYKYGDIGVQFHLQDALGIAAGLHEMFRNSDLVSYAHYAQTVNVLGLIKTTETEAEFDAPGVVFKLYRNHFGTTPIRLEEDTTPLDICAALSEERKILTIGVVNPTDFRLNLRLQVKGAELQKNLNYYLITGDNKNSYNEPGREPSVKVQELALDSVADTLEISPISVSLFKFPIE